MLVFLTLFLVQAFFSPKWLLVTSVTIPSESSVKTHLHKTEIDTDIENKLMGGGGGGINWEIGIDIYTLLYIK